MPSPSDVTEQLHSLGFRASKEALRALLEEATGRALDAGVFKAHLRRRYLG